MPICVSASIARWLLVCFFSLLPFAAANAADPLLLSQALLAIGDGSSFPTEAATATITLPDDGTQPRPGSAAHPGAAWYRFEFDAAPVVGASDALALYLERACTDVDVQLNGERLFASSLGGAALAHDCYHPQLVGVPIALLRAQGNQLDVKLVGLPLSQVASRQRAAYLSAPRLGSMQALAAARDARLFWQETLAQLVGIAAFVVGVAVLFVGWLNVRKVYLLYLGLLAVGYAGLSARIWWRHVPIGPEAVEWAVSALVPLVAACAVLFLMRYAGLRVRALDAALLVQCAIVPASLALAGPARLFVIGRGWNTLLMIEVLLAAAAALWVAWRMRRREFWFLLLPLALIAFALGGELAWQLQWLAEPAPALLQLVTPIAFLGIALRLLHGEVRALRTIEDETRLVIERRIAEATAEAERNYATLAELRVEQVTERERKRIAADLHDDLGAKLLTIVHTSESDRISTLAREALEEMRLSVRGLTGKPVRLVDALGDWRAEVVSRLGQANIGADWEGPTEEPPQTLPARAYVQTTRILREAVSNIIKHSGAARCSISGTVQDGDFVLLIQDNGHGIPMELDGRLDRGHGMASMKHRAKQLQGQCLVESGPGYGTVIRLTIPL